MENSAKQFFYEDDKRVNNMVRRLSMVDFNFSGIVPVKPS